MVFPLSVPVDEILSGKVDIRRGRAAAVSYLLRTAPCAVSGQRQRDGPPAAQDRSSGGLRTSGRGNLPDGCFVAVSDVTRQFFRTGYEASSV